MSKVGAPKRRIEFIGQRLAEECTIQNISYSALAQKLNVSRNAPSDWVKKNLITPEYLKEVSLLLSVSPQYLTGETDNKHEVFQDKNGDLVLNHPSEPSEWFDLMFTDAEEYNRRFDQIVKNVQAEGRTIITESEIQKRRLKERKVALNKLSSFLHTSYIYPDWKHAESDSTLSDLLEYIRMYVHYLPDAQTNGKEGK